MAPAEHLEWFDDNIAWFGQLGLDALTTPVPACPGSLTARFDTCSVRGARRRTDSL